ncbi:hypothetical protein AHAS_Ahas11G0071700 [Arachis hypogaea]
MSTFRPAPDSNTSVPSPASTSVGHAAGTVPSHLGVAVRSSRIDPSWKYVKKNRERQSATPASIEEHSVNARELDLESLGFGLLEEDAQGIDPISNPTPMAAANGGASSMRGPMDLFVKRLETAIVRNKKEKLRQQNIKEALRLKSFQEMMLAVGSFGSNLPAPIYHALRVPFLNEELEYTKDLLKGHKEQ